MWLDELEALLAQGRDSINRHRDLLTRSESTTRYALIDPLLAKIGWRLADPAQVQTEYSIPGGRLDYAMWDGPRLCLVVEAKSLGTKLDTKLETTDKAVQQAIGYCHAKGCDHFVVTNGDEWKGYYLKGFGGLEKNQQLSFRVTQQDSSIMKFFWLWPGNFRGQTASPDLHGRDAQRRGAKHPPPPPSNLIDNAGKGLRDFTLQKKDNPKPRRLHFPNGEVKDVSASWVAVLVTIVQWLVDGNRIRVRVLRSRKGNVLLNDIPKNTNGNDFASPKRVGNFHFEGSVNPQNALKRSIATLEACEVDPNTVRLELSDMAPP